MAAPTRVLLVGQGLGGQLRMTLPPGKRVKARKLLDKYAAHFRLDAAALELIGEVSKKLVA